MNPRSISMPLSSLLRNGACLAISCVLFLPMAEANHQGHERHGGAVRHEVIGEGTPISGASFRVFLGAGKATGGVALEAGQAEAAVRTVVDTVTLLLARRQDFPRFDESLKKDALQQVIIEPTVVNQEGKAFPFLVVRTTQPGRVNLLISASHLTEQGYLNRPDLLAPVLAREFQWVVSKADTAQKPKTLSMERDLAGAPIRTDQDISSLTADERVRLLQSLFETYLRTVDEQKSLEGQPHYEIGTSTLVPPTQPDSTMKWYDIRVREALQMIVREPSFLERTPKAVRSLLNGKVWNVAFVKVEQRDWATRTRVLPEEKAVSVGAGAQRIQPAAVLINTYRTAAPEDPFYPDSRGLPMGALSVDQLARVIALEIQHNITEKSMSGHVAQDALTAPK